MTAMKRIIIMICLILLYAYAYAQYENNRNYILFEDNFDVPGRTWNASYMDSENKWVAYFQGSGITHGTKEHQAYQRSQAVFDYNNEMMLLVADYVSDVDLTCKDLEKPVGGWCNITDEHHIRYISGALESIDKSYLYGYFEMRCKVPVHKSAFPAFWLWSSCKANDTNCDDPHYDEIDIFEYSWVFTDTSEYKYTSALYLGDNRVFTAGTYINNDGETDSLWWEGAARVFPRISEDKPSVDQWNTWGCLWMPDKVEWYLNGELFNSLYDVDKIPHNPMYLIINYAIDNYALDEDGVYYDINDTMYIDYIRAYQPKWDCMTSILIDEQRDLDNYEHGIKSSVSISPNNNTSILLAANRKLDIMASESVTINGPFQVDVGAEFSITMQKCP